MAEIIPKEHLRQYIDVYLDLSQNPVVDLNKEIGFDIEMKGDWLYFREFSRTENRAGDIIIWLEVTLECSSGHIPLVNSVLLNSSNGHVGELDEVWDICDSTIARRSDRF